MDHANTTTRRGFLAQVSLLGAGGVVGMGLGERSPVQGAGASVPGDFLATVTSAQFRPHLGSTFQMYSDAGPPVNLELYQVKELRGRTSGLAVPAGSSRPPFSLLFRTRGTNDLTQRIYRLAHKEIGTFDLFLVRVNPDRQGRTRFEAIFG